MQANILFLQNAVSEKTGVFKESLRKKLFLTCFNSHKATMFFLVSKTARRMKNGRVKWIDARGFVEKEERKWSKRAREGEMETKNQK